MMAAEPRRSGRRPGESSAREDILTAAAAAFAEFGYDRATIRGIAARASVDPALVIHYFGSKDALFAEVLQLPLRPREVFSRAATGGIENIGASVVRSFLEAWEPPEQRLRLTAMLRSATTNDAAMRILRDLLVREVFAPMTEILGVPDGDLRATLVGSQFVGLALMRYIGGVEPLASAPIDELVAAIGPTVQRYLTGDVRSGPVAADDAGLQAASEVRPESAPAPPDAGGPRI